MSPWRTRRKGGFAVSAAVIAAACGVAIAALFDAGSSHGTAVTTVARSDSISVRQVGGLEAQLARLPEVLPGDLAGRLLIANDTCAFRALDLATMEYQTAPAPEANPCSVGGGRTVEPADLDARQNPTALVVKNTSGRLIRRVSIPHGWFWSSSTRFGVVLCSGVGGGDAATFVNFTGRIVTLQSCPLTTIGDQLVFPSPDRRALVDQHDRRIVALHDRLGQFPAVSMLSSGILSVIAGATDHPPTAALYLHGRLLRRVPLEPALDPRAGQRVASTSRDGRIVVVVDDQFGGGSVVFGPHSDAPRRIRAAYAGGIVLASPDGRFIIVRHNQQVVVLDAITLTPERLLRVETPENVYDWRR